MKSVLLILAFTGAMCLGAQVEIPLGPVPFILSDFFVLLAGLVLGAWRGLGSVLLYLALGAAGLPVYAGGAGGVEHLIGPTGGFLVGFAVAGFVAGAVSHGGKMGLLRDFAGTFSGQICFFGLGLIWLKLDTGMAWGMTLEKGLLPFVFPILFKLLAAGLSAGMLRRLFARL